MTGRRALVLLGGISAAVGGALYGFGHLILTVTAANGESFPFGAAFMVFAGPPFTVAGVVMLTVAAVTSRRMPRTHQP